MLCPGHRVEVGIPNYVYLCRCTPSPVTGDPCVVHGGEPVSAPGCEHNCARITFHFFSQCALFRCLFRKHLGLERTSGRMGASLVGRQTGRDWKQMRTSLWPELTALQPSGDEEAHLGI